jgi:SMODS-associating 2TM, beta-strand rich effector domain
MEKINNTIKLHAQIFTFLIIWGAVLLFTQTYSTVDLWTAIKHLPQAISVYAIIGIIFTKWLWRWNFLQGWLIKIPDLQGTWRGELKSDWVNPETGKGIEPIPVVLVIRQTFSNIKCTLMTKESTSYSTTADINVVPNGEDLYLTYNYTNRPKATIRDRSAIHDGASILKIINKPNKCLEGEYWTSRKTRGEIVLTFDSKEIVEQF